MVKIPHIDFNDFYYGGTNGRAKFIQTLGDGICQVGFLTIGNHGLDPELTEKAYACFRDFFALEETVKQKYDSIAGGARGFTPFGREHAKDTPIADLKEFWHVGQELPPDHPYRGHYPDNIWPSEIPEMKDIALKLYRGFERCAHDLLVALAIYFDLPEKTFSDMIQHGNSILRVIHYPPLQDNRDEKAVRAAAHEDINLITLLIESRGGGLEILTQDGTWVPVDALSGDIIVDSGDMLHRLSNGVIPAVTHRVVNPSGEANVSRYSMPFFTHPYSACDLTVMERFTSTSLPPRWPPITANEFLLQRLREIGLTD